MMKETTGKVIACTTQWWLKLNTRPLRSYGGLGAKYPHVIKVRYNVDGRDYTKRKWLSVGTEAPCPGSSVKVSYEADRPARAKILYFSASLTGVEPDWF